MENKFFRGVMNALVIAAVFWACVIALSACSGGSGGAAAGIVPVTDPITATVQACAPTEYGTWPSCTAKTTCAVGALASTCVCESPYVESSTVPYVCQAVPTPVPAPGSDTPPPVTPPNAPPSTPPVAVAPTCPVGDSILASGQFAGECCPTADIDATGAVCNTPSGATAPANNSPTAATCLSQGQAYVNGACGPLPTFAVLSAAAVPATVYDTSLGTSGQGPYVTTVTVQAQSSLPNDFVTCADWQGNAMSQSVPGGTFTESTNPMGPAMDGLVGLTVTCVDLIYSVTAQVSVAFTVLPASDAPVQNDTLTCEVGSDSTGNPAFVCQFNSSLGACWVFDNAMNQGTGGYMNGGGASSGQTIVGTNANAFSPAKYTLQCPQGIDDPTAPTAVL